MPFYAINTQRKSKCHFPFLEPCPYGVRELSSATSKNRTRSVPISDLEGGRHEEQDHPQVALPLLLLILDGLDDLPEDQWSHVEEDVVEQLKATALEKGSPE